MCILGQARAGFCRHSQAGGDGLLRVFSGVRGRRGQADGRAGGRAGRRTGGHARAGQGRLLRAGMGILTIVPV